MNEDKRVATPPLRVVLRSSAATTMLRMREAIDVLTNFVPGDFLAALDDIVARLRNVGETFAAGGFLRSADYITCDVLDLFRQAVGGDALIARVLGDGADGGIRDFHGRIRDLFALLHYGLRRVANLRL